MINNYFSDDDYHPSDLIYTHPIYRHSLHLGDMSSALDHNFLTKNQIKTVITAASGMDHVKYDSGLSIKHIVYSLLDIKSENISKYFSPVCELIEKQLENSNVLVHCAAGISRSATLVIAYLMRHKSWTFREAIAFVRQNRPSVCPNLGFQRQLKEFEQYLSKQNISGLQRKSPRTSQEAKHSLQKGKPLGLPQINILGRTHLKNIVLDPFAIKQAKTSHRARPSQSERQQPVERQYGQVEEIPLKLKPLQPKRTKSLAQKEKRRDELGLEAIGIQSMLVRRVNLVPNELSERSGRRQQLVKPLFRQWES